MAEQILPRAVGAEALTGVLHRLGVLNRARVRQITALSDRTTILSRIIRLRLEYDGQAGDAPGTIICKTGLPERAGSRGGAQEVAFYRDVASATHVRFAPRCFDAHWDAEKNDWHLLLEDLTESHAIATVWPLPPTTEQCERIIDARARFHAVWWDDPRLGDSIGTWRSSAATDRMLSELTAHFARFADRLGDRLSPERRALYERLLDAAPRLLRRYDTRRNITLNHGDAHVWNAFLPRDDSDDVRLFDWDSWRIGVAASDLAYMMALHWFPERRRRLERTLLDRYHTRLLEHGVHGYDRQALDDDYRWAILWQMTTPVWQAAFEIPPVIWHNHMERILLAVDDCGCRALLT